MTTRRSFLQSMAAMFAMPSVTTFAGDYGIRQCDFAPWVCNLSSRFDLSKPFDWDGYSIATDGRKLIRVPLVASVGTDRVRKTPEFGSLPWENLDGCGWKPYSKQRIKLDEGVCENCLGIGWTGNPQWREFDVRLAPKVYQDRFVNYRWEDLALDSLRCTRKHLDEHNGWMTTDWHGDEFCTVCNGVGEVKHGFGRVIDGSIYDGGFVAAVERLGEFETKLEDYELNKWGVKEVHKLLLFRGNGFDGMMMPRTWVN